MLLLSDLNILVIFLGIFSLKKRTSNDFSSLFSRLRSLMLILAVLGENEKKKKVTDVKNTVYVSALKYENSFIKSIVHAKPKKLLSQ